MLWLFTWPFLFFTTKKYSVAKADWPFSKPIQNGESSYATITETQWFQRWRKVIEKAALEKRQGAITEEDLQRAQEPVQVPQTGNQSVDSAIGFISSGLRVYNEVNRQLGWGYDT